MTLTASEIALLRCPDAGDGAPCGGSLVDAGDALVCGRCLTRWPVRDGLARVYREERVRGNDRLLRVFYDNLAALHDPAVRWLIPVLQTEGSERAMREAYLRRMELGALRPRADRGLRVLEVGAGTGANLAFVRAQLPPGLDVAYWSVDLSESMTRRLDARVARDPSIVPGDGRVRRLLCDGHALPFADGTFDRVFSTGGVGGYRDPARALAELARVAVRGTPIVVVDEQLDPARSHSLYHRAMFRAVTFYDRAPMSPRALLPAGAEVVADEQASRFFYSLTFRMPA